MCCACSIGRSLEAMKRDKELLDKELEDLSPYLLNLRSQDDGFRLPANYFETLEDEVFQQIDAIGARRQKRTAGSRSGFWSIIAGLWQPRLALALGTVLVAAFAAWWIWRPQPAPNAELPLAVRHEEPTPDELEAYVMENVLDFEPDQLAALAITDEASQEPSSISNPGNKSIPKPASKATDDLSPEQLEILINDLTDEEIEKML